MKEYENGGKYEGNWSSGVLYSYGKLVCGKNDYYAGYFLNGLFCGTGLRKWPDGSNYDGGWEDGEGSKSVVAARMPMVRNTMEYSLVACAKDIANTETATVWITKVNGFPIIG